MRKIAPFLLPALLLLLWVPPVAAQSAYPDRVAVLQPSNLRAGPGTNYAIVGGAAPGAQFDVIGCNETCDWYHLATDQWIAAFLVEAVAAPPPTAGNCDPAYPDVCIPPPPPDLDCGDVPFRRFTVLSPDPHNFDGDGDGIGCESGAVILPTLTSPALLVTATPTPTTAVTVAAPATNTVELIVGSWNVESGGADAAVVGQRLALFEGVDLWGLSEVQSVSAAEILEAAAEVGEDADFESVVSRSGRTDRLVILYNTERFELLAQDELEYINIGGTVRAPLLIHVRDTESGYAFVFMANHLNRGDDQRRHDQAALLNEWAMVDGRPAIAVGDYNFDWAIAGGDTDHDLGYDWMTA